MNEEKQRIAIAEACGWRYVNDFGTGQKFLWSPEKARLQVEATWGEYSERGPVTNTRDLPDYLHDLNACAEFERTLKSSPLQWGQYCNTLGLLCGGAKADDGGMFVSHKEAIDATAQQRCEAFLRCIEKQEDQP